MVLYTLFALPLFFAFVLSYRRSDRSSPKRLWVQFSRGVLCFVPSYILFAIFSNVVPLSFTVSGIFFFYFFYDTIFYAVTASASFFLVQRFTKDHEGGGASETFVFLSGFFLFVNVLEIIRNFPAYSLYILFLYPTLQIAIVLVLSVVLTRITETNGFARIALGLGGAVFCGLCAFVPYFATIHYPLVAIFGTVLLFAISAFPYVLTPA